MRLLNESFDVETGVLTLWVEPDMSDWSVEIALVPEGETFAASVVEVLDGEDCLRTWADEKQEHTQWLILSYVQDNLHTWWAKYRIPFVPGDKVRGRVGPACTEADSQDVGTVTEVLQGGHVRVVWESGVTVLHDKSGLVLLPTSPTLAVGQPPPCQSADWSTR